MKQRVQLRTTEDSIPAAHGCIDQSSLLHRKHLCLGFLSMLHTATAKRHLATHKLRSFYIFLFFFFLILNRSLCKGNPQKKEAQGSPHHTKHDHSPLKKAHLGLRELRHQCITLPPLLLLPFIKLRVRHAQNRRQQRLLHAQWVVVGTGQ